MIATAPKQVKRLAEERAKSPGPDHYSPDRAKVLKRHRTIIFNQEKRGDMISKDRATSPGPGAYMIPCRFYDFPKFLLKKENNFRYV